MLWEALLLLTVLYVVKRLLTKDPHSHIPGPKALPLLGNLLQVDLKDLGYSCNELRKKYGPVFKLHLAGMKMVVLSDAEDMSSFFNLMPTMLERGSMYEWLVPVHGGKRSLEVLSNSDWKPVRRVMERAFSATSVGQFASVLNEKLPLFLGPIEKAAGKPIRILEVAKLWSMELMCRFAFGFDNGHMLAADMSYLMTFFYDALPWANIFRYWNYLTFLPNVKKMNAAIRNIRSNIEKVITARKSHGVQDHERDLMAELFHAKEQIDTNTLADNCFQMITAGDSTPTAVTSFIYYLSIHPEIQEKLFKEVISEIGKTSVITRDNITRCHYLSMVTKEVLRMAPPVRAPVSRRNIQEMTFSGIKIPAGTDICYCCYSAQYNENYWPEPEKFDPERWSEANHDNRHSMGWFPFLAGNRNCLGQAIALLEMKSIMAELVRRYTFTIPSNYKLSWVNAWLTCPADLDVTFTDRK